MKKIILSGALCTLALLGGSKAAFAATATSTATTTPPVAVTTSVKPSQADMLAQIQQLMKLIADLKAKLTEAQGQIQVLAKDLGLGAKGDDVMKAQELLASDPTIFKAKPTGFFGPLTQEALKKFQTQYNLPVTGKLDEATRDVMKQLRAENKDGKIPFGFIKRAEMHDKIKMHLEEKWGKCGIGATATSSATTTVNCMKKGKDGKKEGEGEKHHLATSSREFAADIRTNGTSTKPRIEKSHGTSTKDHAEKPHATSTKERGEKEHATSTKNHAASTSAGAGVATKAIADAKVAIDALAASLTGSSTASTTDKQTKEAMKRLAEAKKKLIAAQLKFDLGKYKDATRKALEAMKIAKKPLKK
jgi:peptidoglycan hydrolase-like protein with peptidoglycan-binding domain